MNKGNEKIGYVVVFYDKENVSSHSQSRHRRPVFSC